MGFRPHDGWADALHGVYLPGGRVAFTYGRRTDLTPATVEAFGPLGPAVGNLTLHRREPFRRWNITYAGEAQHMADATVMITASKDRPAGWMQPMQLQMDVAFVTTSEPHYTTIGAEGHFEQTGRVTGEIRLGEESWDVNGYGVRDKSWGPRTWQASIATEADRTPFLNWFSINFGPDLALGGLCDKLYDRTLHGTGWIQRNDTMLDLTEVTVTTRYNPLNPLLHESLQVRGTDSDGTTFVVDGTVLSICPTKIPRPDGVTFVNEGLARFHSGGRTGFGIAEHWHAVAR